MYSIGVKTLLKVGTKGGMLDLVNLGPVRQWSDGTPLIWRKWEDL